MGSVTCLNTLAFGQPLRTRSSSTLSLTGRRSQYPRIRAASSDFLIANIEGTTRLVSIPSHSGSLFGLANRQHQDVSVLSQYPRIRAASSDQRGSRNLVSKLVVSIPSHSGSLFGHDGTVEVGGPLDSLNTLAFGQPLRTAKSKCGRHPPPRPYFEHESDLSAPLARSCGLFLWRGQPPARPVQGVGQKPPLPR